VNVYRIQAKRIDEAVDFCLSHFVEGRVEKAVEGYYCNVDETDY
jgi:hypothetical protein